MSNQKLQELIRESEDHLVMMKKALAGLEVEDKPEFKKGDLCYFWDNDDDGCPDKPKYPELREYHSHHEEYVHIAVNLEGEAGVNWAYCELANLSPWINNVSGKRPKLKPDEICFVRFRSDTYAQYTDNLDTIWTISQAMMAEALDEDVDCKGVTHYMIVKEVYL